MKAKISDFSIDFSTRKQRLTLILDGDFRNLFDALKDFDLDFTIKKYRKKRSLNANAYCWELIGQLSEKTNLPSLEIYRNAIREVGIYKDFDDMEESQAKTLCAAWGRLGLGWITEQLDYAEDGDRVIIRCYYGSSSYNTAQMSRLIYYIVADCKEIGIETKTPAELAILKDTWKKE